MVAVRSTTTPDFVLGQEQVLFRGTGYRADSQHAQYDVALDLSDAVGDLRPAGVRL